MKLIATAIFAGLALIALSIAVTNRLTVQPLPPESGWEWLVTDQWTGKIYACPHSLAVVRMRFWGAINSPANRISPIGEIDALGNGNLPSFKIEDKEQAFYDGMIGLWNWHSKP